MLRVILYGKKAEAPRRQEEKGHIRPSVLAPAAKDML
jgi:hypothetical protein